ncbi:hypothetical protein K2173_003899 [Erythroxylum novogranatense]|uniref:Rhodanese domain-containing protein n=1 Tax=Erythroxylum novogranatense TaxID=1862640 RepID=A0AAV8SJ67_9ROSI|nr:hypothetical protein K2173_003899 [Erythroxylum novogranatense]
MVENDNQGKEEEEYGVLLYYNYGVIDDLDSLFSFFQTNCSSLSLLGRVRISSHGVNVTVGGKLSSLEKHIVAVKSFTLFEGTDFKFATSPSPLDDKVAYECGFTSLSIRIVKELVTFSPNPLLKSPDISNAGRHLSAKEFHSVLLSACQLAEKDSLTENKKLVLLDARNLYETRIGKFDIPISETLDPGIRQYSDLASWIDSNAEQLRGKNVLMYCTGGIRCEMASAYIKSKGAGFEHVFQLYGGIQRYLEQFPDGGFFKGKNFVFDHRISVGSMDTNILGTCLLCGLSFDDYSSRCRCSHCRMLVLVCDSCRTEEALYVCELCQKHGRGVELLPSIQNGKSQEIVPNIELGTISLNSTIAPHQHREQGDAPSRKLKILCLHGFRQNASSFKGRTASLAKKLKNIAELVYIDAPHELPFIYQPRVNGPKCNDDISFSSTQVLPPKENSKRKFAWLISPDFKGRNETEWEMAQCPFDALQYQQQTDGLDLSITYLKTVISREGPFDGILGFSQGAAMAASFCAQESRLKGEINFRFVILCSGFSQLGGVECGSIDFPALHVYGNIMAKDSQIANQASRHLASLFTNPVIIEHDCGHIIPTRPPYVDEIKFFLKQFL